jgi:hypothetical protein
MPTVPAWVAFVGGAIAAALMRTDGLIVPTKTKIMPPLP